MISKNMSYAVTCIYSGVGATKINATYLFKTEEEAKKFQMAQVATGIEQGATHVAHSEDGWNTKIKEANGDISDFIVSLIYR